MARGDDGILSSGAIHVPVMAEEVVAWLRVDAAGVYVDCTVGLGGHAEKIAQRLGQGRLIGLDRDPGAVALAGQRLASYPQVEIHHWNYGELASLLEERGIVSVDGVLIDAGFSGMQLGDARRGFTFEEEGPLDMRMDTSRGPTARDLLAAIAEKDLARILKEHGDVGPARRIAASIIARRNKGALETTTDLAGAVAEALPFVENRPIETRTVFQAVRMAVNEELEWFEAGLRQAVEALAPRGRLVVITFHSGEDRVVKNVMREASRPRRELFPDGRLREVIPPRLRLLTPKPVLPTEHEIRRNSRAHSAKLRAAERV